MLAIVAAEVWPTSLVLPRGQVDAAVTLEVEPAQSVAPDLWWGVTDRFTLGVVTSARAQSRIEARNGVCVHGCDRLYDNVALDGRWSLQGGAFAIAARVRLGARSFAPFRPTLRPGVLLRWWRGAFAVEADPHLQLGLAHRAEGNRDQLALPVWLRAQLGCRASLWLFTGARGEAIDFAEKYAVPFALGAAVRVGPVVVGAEAGFAALLGPQNQLADHSASLFVEIPSLL
jgi:hypothetical protein